MTMRHLLLALSLLVAATLPGRAWPHAFLDHAVPSVGGTVATPPAKVQMFFSEAIEPAFSGAEITAGHGQPIAAGAAAVDSQNGMELVLSLPTLAPGHYTVHWHVVSVDTHRTEGTFSFEVGP
jgi:hypothetical protein